MKRPLLLLAAILFGACAPKSASGPVQRDSRSTQIVEVRAAPDRIAEDVTVVRFVFTATARYKVYELPGRQEIWIDVEGGVPNAQTSQIGGAVDRISYTTATHAEGGTTLGRVILHLADPSYGLVSMRNGDGRVGEIRIGPNRHTNESAPPRLRKTLGDTEGETE